MLNPHQSPQKSRIVSRDGKIQVVRKGISHFSWTDLYHWLLNLAWHKLLAVISVAYIIANAVFALAYLAGGNGIANARPGSFLDAFFFSVQTMASIGYGAMYPQTAYANILVTIEALLGLIGLSMATGLMFARFSRPTARVIFTNTAVVSIYNGVPTLMFRVANERQNWILEAQMRVSVARNEITKEGLFMRRFYDLPLVRSYSPLFALSWTIMHTIDESSPLYGLSPEKMAEDEVELVVILTGIDETVSQAIHARHSFIAEEILWNMRFVDIMTRKPDGKRCINYFRFHDVESID